MTLLVQMRQHLKWAAITFGNRASGRKCVEQREVMHTRGLLPITYYRLRLEWAFKDRLKTWLGKDREESCGTQRAKFAKKVHKPPLGWLKL